METTKKGTSLRDVINNAILPALDLMPAMPVTFRSREAELMLVAIGLQESRFKHRRQIGGGPARGFWQFERGGGVRGVLRHTSTARAAMVLCEFRHVAPNEADVYAALELDDILAAGFARLLLFTDPRRLPDVGRFQDAWDLYIRTWRPGWPHRGTWDELYAQAVAAVTA